MPRPERVIDPGDGPVAAFALELRALRAAAGNPLYATMARTSGKATSTLADAAGGRRLPSRATVEAYVRACGGGDDDVARWRERWERAGAAAPEPALGPPPAPVPPAAPARSRWRRGLPAVLAGLALVVAAVSGLVVGHVTRAPAAAPVTAPVTVQNQVALGADALVEDSTPAYLSTVPRPYCAREGCAVPDTSMGSGVVLTALCRTAGTVMHNYDVGSEYGDRNPNAVRSATWYRVRDAAGAEGYLSEVYLSPASRGGLGLPACP